MKLMESEMLAITFVHLPTQENDLYMWVEPALRACVLIQHAIRSYKSKASSKLQTAK